MDSNELATYEIPDSPSELGLQKPFFDYASMGSGGTALVIDNGSNTCRAGWASEADPRLEFDNIVSKYRNRKVSTNAMLLVGNDVHTDPIAKTNSRSGFDNGIMTNFEVMESTLDYIFTILGCVDTHVNQPIVMTEAVCNPYTSRKNMSELLFECYGVPSVTYGIDSVWSYYQNMGSFDIDGLIVSTGNSTSHVIPVYDARAHTEDCRRLNVGGVTMRDYLMDLVHLKYPSFPVKLSEWQAEHIIRKFAYFSTDYDAELATFLDRDKLESRDRIIQFPFTMPNVDERTEEEIAQASERRREQAKRMQEMAARKRQEKIAAKEEELSELVALRDNKESIDTGDFIMKLKELGLANEDELLEAIKSAENVINRANNKEDVEEKPPSFPLVNVPDEELTDEQKKEKRKQVFLKASHDARERAKLEKEAERLKQEEAAQKDEEKRLNHFDEWLGEIQAKRNEILGRITERQTLRKELNDRRSHASQLRMRSIADLAANETTTNGNKRRRRDELDDNFGESDEDWNVYRDISKEELEEENEEDFAELDKYDKLLERHAPYYLEGLDRIARDKIERTVVYRFTEGCMPAILDKPAAPQNLDNKTIVARAAREYQMHVNIERIRVPEVVFRPSLVGVDQAGILETAEGILNRVARTSLVKNVFVTGGGFSLVPNLSERLQIGITSIMPTGTPIKVRRAADPVRDAWRGAAKWCTSEPDAFKRSCVTKADYLECGGEYLREHGASNRYHKI